MLHAFMTKKLDKGGFTICTQEPTCAELPGYDFERACAPPPPPPILDTQLYTFSFM